MNDASLVRDWLLREFFPGAYSEPSTSGSGVHLYLKVAYGNAGNAAKNLALAISQFKLFQRHVDQERQLLAKSKLTEEPGDESDTQEVVDAPAPESIVNPAPQTEPETPSAGSNVPETPAPGHAESVAVQNTADDESDVVVIFEDTPTPASPDIGFDSLTDDLVESMSRFDTCLAIIAA